MVVTEISRIEDESKVYVEAVVGPYEVEFVQNNETEFKNLTICKTADAPKFLPVIYFDRNLARNEDGTFRRVARFKAQTTSYGAITLEEFEQFVGAQQTALDAIAAIKEYFNVEEVL